MKNERTQNTARWAMVVILMVFLVDIIIERAEYADTAALPTGAIALILLIVVFLPKKSRRVG